MDTTQNLCAADRAIRMIAGLILVATGLVLIRRLWGLVLVALGAVLVLSSFVGFCHVYKALGISTCDVGGTRTGT